MDVGTWLLFQVALLTTDGGISISTSSLHNKRQKQKYTFKKAKRCFSASQKSRSGLIWCKFRRRFCVSEIRLSKNQTDEADYSKNTKLKLCSSNRFQFLSPLSSADYQQQSDLYSCSFQVSRLTTTQVGLTWICWLCRKKTGPSAVWFSLFQQNELKY